MKCISRLCLSCSAAANDSSRISAPALMTTSASNTYARQPSPTSASYGPVVLAAKIKTLPESLRLSLTWDQGPEMREWEHVKVDAGIDIYFCDPRSPWQRGTNENTNGLLRQYFPKGTDLGVHSSEDLDWVAQELNDRPRKRLAFMKPIELIGDLLLQ